MSVLTSCATATFTSTDASNIKNLKVPYGFNEAGRISTLRQTDMLDTDINDVRFDSFTTLASRSFDAPFSFIALIDANRSFVKSDVHGQESSPYYDRNDTFCTFTILPESPDVVAIEDTLKDSRVMYNIYVTGPPYFRSYLGAALIINGYKLGTLCILDTKPREFSMEDRIKMLEFGALVARILQESRETRLTRDFNVFNKEIRKFQDVQKPIARVHTLLEMAKSIDGPADCVSDIVEIAPPSASLSDLDKHAEQLSALMNYYSSIEFMTEILMAEVRFPSMCGVNCDMPQLIDTMQQMMSLFLPVSAVQWNISEEVSAVKICQTYPILLSTVMLFAGGHIAQHSSSVSVSVYVRHDIPSSQRSDNNDQSAGDGLKENIGLDMAGLFDSLMIEIKGAKYVENKAVDLISKTDVTSSSTAPTVGPSASTNSGNDDGTPTGLAAEESANEEDTTHYNELKLHKMPTADTSEASMHNYAKSQDNARLGSLRSLPVSNMLDTVCGGCHVHLSPESGTLSFTYWAPYCGSELSSEESADNTVSRVVPPLMPAMKHLKTSNVLHVLVVDDDVQMRNILSNWLSDLGCVVETAETGRLGLMKLKADVFDMVFVDFLMPVMSGVDMLREYRLHHSESLKQGTSVSPRRSSMDHAVFVGMLCGGEGFGLNPSEQARDAAEQGVHVFVKKPLDHAFVKSMVEHVRARGRKALSDPEFLEQIYPMLKTSSETHIKVARQNSSSSMRKFFSPVTQMFGKMSSRIKPM